jgi:hypothetical protein
MPGDERKRQQMSGDDTKFLKNYLTAGLKSGNQTAEIGLEPEQTPTSREPAAGTERTPPQINSAQKPIFNR